MAPTEGLWPAILEEIQRSVRSQQFDTWFRNRVCEYHGVDFSHIIATKPPQLIMNWQAPRPVEVPV